MAPSSIRHLPRGLWRPRLRDGESGRQLGVGGHWAPMTVGPFRPTASCCKGRAPRPSTVFRKSWIRLGTKCRHQRLSSGEFSQPFVRSTQNLARGMQNPRVSLVPRLMAPAPDARLPAWWLAAAGIRVRASSASLRSARGQDNHDRQVHYVRQNVTAPLPAFRV